MSTPVVRDDFSRAEAVGGIVWLSIGAAVSILLELVYLNATLFGMPFPVTIAAAAIFNLVLTRTARLWSPNPAVALIPVAVWSSLFFILMFALPSTGFMLVPVHIFTVMLFIAGVMGGMWPAFSSK
ncbi:hypothetical protein [Corynebacterium mayonis]|uniref:hypothetical protein n=1 Tax=Corynebacterium mayonis TaxID=3062461 RepID=UPI00314091D3